MAGVPYCSRMPYERLGVRVAIVTGANHGIGAATAGGRGARRADAAGPPAGGSLT